MVNPVPAPRVTTGSVLHVMHCLNKRVKHVPDEGLWDLAVALAVFADERFDGAFAAALHEEFAGGVGDVGAALSDDVGAVFELFEDTDFAERVGGDIRREESFAYQEAPSGVVFSPDFYAVVEATFWGQVAEES